MPYKRVMAALLNRELLAATRTRGVWAAASIHVAALSTFLFVWGDGVPALSGTALDQFTAVQQTLLALLLPWVACRSLGATRNDLAHFAAAMAAHPRHLLATKWAAVCLVTLAVAAAGLPHAVVAHRVAGESALTVAAYLGSLASVCILVASVVVAWMLTATGRLSQWVGATAMVVGVLMVVPDGRGALVAVAAGLGMLAVLAADRRLRYMA